MGGWVNLNLFLRFVFECLFSLLNIFILKVKLQVNPFLVLGSLLEFSRDLLHISRMDSTADPLSYSFTYTRFWTLTLTLVGHWTACSWFLSPADSSFHLASLSLLSLASSCSLFVVSNRAHDNRFELSWYRTVIGRIISGQTVIQKLDPDTESCCFVWWQKSCRLQEANSGGRLDVCVGFLLVLKRIFSHSHSCSFHFQSLIAWGHI